MFLLCVYTYNVLKTFRVGIFIIMLSVAKYYYRFKSILDIILMRAINVKNSERRESIQLLKFLVDTIV